MEVRIMFGISLDGEILPVKFKTERSANMWRNKFIRKYIADNVPCANKKRQKVSKEYYKGIESKFKVVQVGVKLRKAVRENRQISGTI
jgi:hypothetical protein